MSFSLTLQIKGIFTSGVNLCSDLLRHKVEIKIENLLGRSKFTDELVQLRKIFFNEWSVRVERHQRRL